MKQLFILGLCTALISCGSNSPEKKLVTDTSNATKTDSSTTKKVLAIDTMAHPGKVGKSVFLQDGKAIFYYDVDKKEGHVTINGTKYNFDYFNHKINEPDFLLKSGSILSIKVEGTKYYDYENPEPGILKGKAAKVTIKLGGDSLVLNNKVEVYDGINAD